MKMLLRLRHERCWGELASFSPLLLLEMGSHVAPSYSQNWYVAEDGLQFLILVPPPPRSRDTRRVLPHLTLAFFFFLETIT